MAYDADGSVGLYSLDETDPFIEISGAIAIEWNDEDNVLGVPRGSSTGTGTKIGVIFPELREVDGVYASVEELAANRLNDFETSVDTTNIVDGTWVLQIADLSTACGAGVTYPSDYRNEIASLAVSGIRGIRFDHQVDQSDFRTLHLYGEITAGETPDRLLWIDEITGLEFTLPIDYGDVPRGSARDRGTRLKNNSATLTADTLQITAEALYLASGGWYTFDVAGGGFVSTNSDITSLGSTATSSLITIRQIVPDAETIGLHTARAYVNVASWS